MSAATAAKATPKTLSGWKKAKRHTVILPSGFSAEIEIPNLPLMIKTGAIPNGLLSAALGAIERQEVTAELIKEQSDFYELLVSTMVKEPELTPADVQDIPFEDVEMLVELGTRNRDVDATGLHIGGLHTSKDWRVFRGLEERE